MKFTIAVEYVNATVILPAWGDVLKFDIIFIFVSVTSILPAWGDVLKYLYNTTKIVIYGFSPHGEMY